MESVEIKLDFNKDDLDFIKLLGKTKENCPFKIKLRNYKLDKTVFDNINHRLYFKKINTYSTVNLISKTKIFLTKSVYDDLNELCNSIFKPAPIALIATNICRLEDDVNAFLIKRWLDGGASDNPGTLLEDCYCNILDDSLFDKY